MIHYLKKIIPFFIITMLAAGGVETFYRITFTRLLHNAPAPAIQDQVRKLEAPSVTEAKKQPDYQIIVKRNLFGSSTKAGKETTGPAVPEKIAITSSELSLLGTISGQPNMRRAIILDKKKKVQDIYYQGDAVQGAVIKEIQRGKVILNINGNDEILIPETPKASATPAPGLASPPPPPEMPPETPPEVTQEPAPEIPTEPVMEPPEPVAPNAVEAPAPPSPNPAPSANRLPNVFSPANKNNTPETP